MLTSHPFCLAARLAVLEAEGRIDDAVSEYGRAHEVADWDSEVAARRAALAHR